MEQLNILNCSNRCLEVVATTVALACDGQGLSYFPKSRTEPNEKIKFNSIRIKLKFDFLLSVRNFSMNKTENRIIDKCNYYYF